MVTQDQWPGKTTAIDLYPTWLQSGPQGEVVGGGGV